MNRAFRGLLRAVTGVCLLASFPAYLLIVAAGGMIAERDDLFAWAATLAPPWIMQGERPGPESNTADAGEALLPATVSLGWPHVAEARVYDEIATAVEDGSVETPRPSPDIAGAPLDAVRSLVASMLVPSLPTVVAPVGAVAVAPMMTSLLPVIPATALASEDDYHLDVPGSVDWTNETLVPWAVVHRAAALDCRLTGLRQSTAEQAEPAPMADGARTGDEVVGPGQASPDQAVDPGLLRMNELRLGVAVPAQQDEQGEPLPMPEDHARAYFAKQGAVSDEPLPYNPWLQELGYGPALNFCYGPLRFEEVNLERYGNTVGFAQPVVSAARFVGTIPLLPYEVIAYAPNRPLYHAHFFRPGAPAPCEHAIPRLSAGGGLSEAAVIVGLVFLIP